MSCCFQTGATTISWEKHEGRGSESEGVWGMNDYYEKVGEIISKRRIPGY